MFKSTHQTFNDAKSVATAKKNLEKKLGKNEARATIQVVECASDPDFAKHLKEHWLQSVYPDKFCLVLEYQIEAASKDDALIPLLPIKAKATKTICEMIGKNPEKTMVPWKVRSAFSSLGLQYLHQGWEISTSDYDAQEIASRLPGIPDLLWEAESDNKKIKCARDISAKTAESASAQFKSKLIAQGLCFIPPITAVEDTESPYPQFVVSTTFESQLTLDALRREAERDAQYQYTPEEAAQMFENSAATPVSQPVAPPMNFAVNTKTNSAPVRDEDGSMRVSGKKKAKEEKSPQEKDGGAAKASTPQPQPLPSAAPQQSISSSLSQPVTPAKTAAADTDVEKKKETVTISLSLAARYLFNEIKNRKIDKDGVTVTARSFPESVKYADDSDLRVLQAQNPFDGPQLDSCLVIKEMALTRTTDDVKSLMFQLFEGMDPEPDILVKAMKVDHCEDKKIYLAEVKWIFRDPKQLKEFSQGMVFKKSQSPSDQSLAVSSPVVAPAVLSTSLSSTVEPQSQQLPLQNNISSSSTLFAKAPLKSVDQQTPSANNSTPQAESKAQTPTLQKLSSQTLRADGCFVDSSGGASIALGAHVLMLLDYPKIKPEQRKQWAIEKKGIANVELNANELIINFPTYEYASQLAAALNKEGVTVQKLEDLQGTKSIKTKFGTYTAQMKLAHKEGVKLMKDYCAVFERDIGFMFSVKEFSQAYENVNPGVHARYPDIKWAGPGNTAPMPQP